MRFCVLKKISILLKWVDGNSHQSFVPQYQEGNRLDYPPDTMAAACFTVLSHSLCSFKWWDKFSFYFHKWFMIINWRQLYCLVFPESVLFVAPVGLQLTTTYQSGYHTSHFIPWHFITDVIINEAITQVCRKIFIIYRVIFLHKGMSSCSCVKLRTAWWKW